MKTANRRSGSNLIIVCQIVLVITVLFNASAIAQKATTRFATSADVTTDSVTKRINDKSCNLISSYIPDTLHPEFTPMYYVRINIHVMLDGNGKHNFSETEGRKWIKEMVSDANQRLVQNQKMFLPHGNNTPVPKVPFRFVLTGVRGDPNDDGIYFHKDDSLFYVNKNAKGTQVNNVYDPRQYKVYGVQKDSVINVFLLEHHPDSLNSKTYRASNDGIGVGNWAKLIGCYYIWSHPTITDKGDTFRFTPWEAAGLLNHELGHCLGLQHTWNMDDGCDDTPKNPGCWNFNEPAGCTDVSNNVMDYNAYKNSLSPDQVGRVVHFFFGSTRKYLEPRWCDYDSSKTITVHNGETIEFNGSMDVYGDLIVENNATLIVHCSLSLPPGGKIILAPKSTLILDGCIVTSRCTSPFEGIEISVTKKSAPVIKMKNGAVIQNVKNQLSSP